MASRTSGSGFWEPCTYKGAGGKPCNLSPKADGPRRVMASKVPAGQPILCAVHAKAAGQTKLAVPQGDTRAQRASMTEAQIKAASSKGEWKLDYTYGGKFNRITAEGIRSGGKAQAQAPRVAAQAKPRQRKPRPQAKSA